MITKNDAATAVLGKMTFDCALPQEWLNQAQQSTGRNVSGDYVWCYPERDMSGLIMPIIGRGYNVDDSKALAEYHRSRLALYENKRGLSHD